MPRSLPDDKEALLRKLIREGRTTRAIAEQVGCGTGTITRRKNEMGMQIRTQVSKRVTTLLAPKPMPPPFNGVPTNPSPSPAAQRLAAFDPIIRRALGERSEENDDGE